jgi:hypothetical protein
MGTYTYIFELLYSNECVVFPGLGGFVTNYRPARIHPVLHTFSPPAKELLFNPRLRSNDGLLANYIAQKESITYEEALRLLSEEAARIQELLNTSRRFEILNVGVIYKDIEGKICFEPSGEVNFLLSSFGLGEFISPAINRDRKIRHIEARPVLSGPGETRRLHIPATLVRAAVIAIPVIALSVLGWFNSGTITNWASQTSELLPKWSNENPLPVSTKAVKPLQKPVFQARKVSDNSTLPAVVSASGSFAIIGNCFSIEDNARNYVNDLKSAGFTEAGYLPADGKALFKAYFGRYQSRAQAETALQDIKKSRAPQAWIMQISNNREQE